MMPFQVNSHLRPQFPGILEICASWVSSLFLCTPKKLSFLSMLSNHVCFFLMPFPNPYLSQLCRLWTQAPSVRERGSPALGIKMEAVLLLHVLACLTLVRGMPFCRSKFCLVHQISSMCLICDHSSTLIFLTRLLWMVLFVQGWLQTAILLISASRVARITGVNHRHPTKNNSLKLLKTSWL
jgi:hypothetical protein